MGIMRRRRVVRAAAVGGVAYAAGRHQGRNAAENEYYAEEEPQPAAGGITADTVEQLEQLAKLKEQGILTDEEFAAEKARLLGGDSPS